MSTRSVCDKEKCIGPDCRLPENLNPVLESRQKIGTGN